jgi:AAA domain
MNFVIANTFSDALARLPTAEQKRAKQAAFDFQLDPSSPGFRFHRVERCRDDRFWSARVDDDLRLIVHKDGSNHLLCYVGRHDDAYAWAERRKIAVHPRTGAAQIVVLREVEEMVTVRPVASDDGSVETVTPVLGHCSEDALLDLGVPPDWLDTVRSVDQDGLLGLIGILPEEAMERLLVLASGEVVDPEPIAEKAVDPYQHPDAQRRFRVLRDQDELRHALEYPWAKWLVFLHPSQRKLVERRYGGPARVTGSAGTGKTIVAIHRVAHLARTNSSRRILLASFSKTLARQIERKLHLLIDEDGPLATSVTVANLHRLAYERYLSIKGLKGVNIATDAYVHTAIEEARRVTDCADHPTAFLVGEWKAIVEPWAIRNWDGYRSVSRVGRGVQLGLRQKQRVWKVFEYVRHRLADRNHVTFGDILEDVGRWAAERPERLFDHVVIDEAQDFGLAELRFVRAITKPGRDDFMFCGDIGQQIFQRGVSWLGLGIDVRGRSNRLKVNYRTSLQIRRFADAIIPGRLTNADGETEDRGTVSLFEGPDPEVRGFGTNAEEIGFLAAWLCGLLAEGLYRAKSRCSPARRRCFAGPGRLPGWLGWSGGNSPTTPPRSATCCRSARCTGRRGWSSRRSRWSGAITTPCRTPKL